MMIPVRCFTCGSLIADKWEPFIARVNAGDHPAKVLDELGVKRYCCRRMFLSHIDIINEVIHYTRPI
ncbi:DNA-directed RNA polymerase subunit N [Sulfolobus tengchongensis]|uniref:DNA-directed RNA polymerase subunit Rpo10 n=1 Tax=Sulfolobus tengchongensis TaxID=207809 RepID=A0AAX4L136_9CREN